VAVFEKAISPGAPGPLYSAIAAALYNEGADAVLSSFVGGLGGKDVGYTDIERILAKIKDGKKHREWV